MNAEHRLAAHYAKVRARCYGQPQLAPVDKPKPLVWTFRARLGFVPPKREAWQKIVDEVCIKHRIGYPDMMTRATGRPYKTAHNVQTRARWECWWRIRHELTVNKRRPNMNQIARWFGLADHSSVSYGLKQYAVILKRQELGL